MAADDRISRAAEKEARVNAKRRDDLISTPPSKAAMLAASAATSKVPARASQKAANFVGSPAFGAAAGPSGAEVGWTVMSDLLASAANGLAERRAKFALRIPPIH